MPGSLSATSGVVDDSLAPTLRWSGVLVDTPEVTITYVVIAGQASGAVTNTATVNAGSAGQFTRSATVILTVGRHTCQVSAIEALRRVT